jgi:hypothetical protein
MQMLYDKSVIWNDYVHFTMAVSVIRLKNLIGKSLLPDSEFSFKDLPYFVIAEFEDKLNTYLNSIDDDTKKHLILKRLQDDIRQTSGLFNAESVVNHITELMTIDDSLNTEIVECIDLMKTIIHDDIIQGKLIEVEENLLAVKPPNKRKTKPTKETELALNQNELMYLFIKLGTKNLFTKQDKTHLARGIESLSGFSANKTREKGETLKLSELENIKTILNNISASIDLDIKKVQSKV